MNADNLKRYAEKRRIKWIRDNVSNVFFIFTGEGKSECSCLVHLELHDPIQRFFCKDWVRKNHPEMFDQKIKDVPKFIQRNLDRMDKQKRAMKKVGEELSKQNME